MLKEIVLKASFSLGRSNMYSVASRVVMALLLVVFCQPSPASAWSEAGHKIIASIAFRKLSPATQNRLAALLKNHPRYAEDFDYFMPPTVKAGDEAMRNEWLLQQAAIWPDMARGLPEEMKARYNHPTWHYIDIPSFLSDDDRTASGRI